ncbi:tetratricopeptide repeat protein [Sedimentitalea arenosa]|uniref:Tetratricopeptide repeat protein 38 n=1 Tax=Sedimentitalea arenosa TaxID=2798803 RepID=A0A8J7LV76_9RHOB|nr:tetratricopeptide repeat protein [Arenibacterium arenosum]MBJ6370665.1 tetratricopeptide repeat protein [Arenibacterium arenosum]
MALTDSYGNEVTTTSAAARDHYDLGLHLFLGGEFGATEAFAQAIAADPDFALAHAAHARASMMASDMAAAKASIARAQDLSEYLTVRERQHIDALALLLSGQAAQARAATLAHVQDHPRDALAAQLCSNVFGLIGFSGEVGREAELLAYTSALLPHYGEDWWMMSMHALALCETGKIDASQQLMERALAINPRNANGAHFKAHAHYEAGQSAAGRAYLAAWMQDYDPRAVLHGHLSWHQALWALHAGDEAEMWAAIDAGVAPTASQGLPINVLTDTAAILYRAELAGVSVDPARWAALSDYATRVFPETGQSFADLHAALSHAMAGQGDRLAHIAETAQGFAGDLVRPVARAWGAIARGDWAEALQDLVPVMAATERLGGSRAQRDLLELTYANVLLKLGQTDEARRSLATRRPMLASAPPVAALA